MTRLILNFLAHSLSATELFALKPRFPHHQKATPKPRNYKQQKPFPVGRTVRLSDCSLSFFTIVTIYSVLEVLSIRRRQPSSQPQPHGFTVRHVSIAHLYFVFTSTQAYPTPSQLAQPPVNHDWKISAFE
ncbi:hypothetical protein BDW02DRAFT_564170 [Decorospora gaudefroyi]|uniref:Uncharacterized protein n=1 Tax=Decorospora gaudefroyi TaxID=184978 RepID=A0A6A5KSI7_9PLEO|nr:hypothetical protein BDW02DRAFT_564170 [Decorospora gaudefroyi]